MSRYTFTFKKDNIFVEFTTEDRDVVERQFQIWVADADNYARANKSKSSGDKTINSTTASETKEEAKPPAAEQPSEQPQPEPADIVETPVAIVEEQKNQIEEAPEETFEAEQEQEPEEPVFDKASSLLKTINSIQNEQGEVIAEEAKEEITEQKAPETVDFESVLEKSIENPTFEPEKTKDQVFLNLVNSKGTSDKFHYLIITAYYLSEFEKMERFSLKQINSKLMHNISAVIDHATLQEAINQELIELIPDLTGVSGVGEYKLTRLGEDFFANQI